MTNHCRLLLSLLFLLLTAAACDQASIVVPEPTTIVIAGSTAMQPVLAGLTDAFVQEHPNVLFDIRGGGSRLGEERLARGEIDMAASTILPQNEKALEAQSGDSARLIHTPIGLDGLAIVVNRHNPLDELIVQQLRDLFSGRVLVWDDLLPPKPDGENGEGYPPADQAADQPADQQEVLLVSRESGSGSRALFEEIIMGESAVSLTAVVLPSSADVVDYVGAHPNAVGYASRAYLADRGADDAPDVHPVRVEGVDPTADDFNEQGYFLTQPLFLVTDGEPSGWSRSFIDFVLSPTGQEIVDRYHVRIR